MEPTKLDTQLSIDNDTDGADSESFCGREEHGEVSQVLQISRLDAPSNEEDYQAIMQPGGFYCQVFVPCF